MAFAFQCRRCRFIDVFLRRVCLGCGETIGVEAIDQMVYDIDEIRLKRIATLAHNLAIGGALCRAHNIGEGSGYEWATREPIWPRWEPGCNREARLAEEERKQPGAFADIYGDRSKWRAP